MLDSFPCPRCGRPCDSGGFEINGRLVPLGLFQCDHCTVDFVMEGKSFPAALTFFVDAEGRAFDSVNLNPLPTDRDPQTHNN